MRWSSPVRRLIAALGFLLPILAQAADLQGRVVGCSGEPTFNAGYLPEVVIPHDY